MRRSVVELGPPIEFVPARHFTRVRLSEAQLAEAWKVVGPSIDRNLARLPLWRVIAMVYLEGLQHGAALSMETDT